MQKVKRVLAVLGLVWAVDIALAHISPRTWMNLHVFVMNVSWHLHHLSDKGSQEWLIGFVLVPVAILVVLTFSVIGFVRVVQLSVRGVRSLRP